MRGILFVLLLAGPAGAKTISFPGDYHDLQAAVNAAVNGDVIQIGPGVYVLPGAVIVATSLTIRGSLSGSTLQANTSDAFDVSGGVAFTLDQLTIQLPLDLVHCFAVSAAHANVRITNSAIHGNGVASYSSEGSVALVNSSIDTGGSGVDAVSNVTIVNSLLTGLDTAVSVQQPPLLVGNSIVAGDGDCVMLFAGLLQNLGNNFIGSFFSGPNHQPWCDSDVIGYPMPSVLADAFTITADSPFRDHGFEACVDDTGAPLTRDRLGNPRSDGRCDAGPLEFQLPPAAPAPLTCDLSSLTAQLGQVQSQLQSLTAQIVVDPTQPPSGAATLTGNVADTHTLVQLISTNVSALSTTTQAADSGILSACSANASATQLSALQDQTQKLADRGNDFAIEDRLAKDQPGILSLELPAPWGQLDRVRAITNLAVSNATAAGLADGKAATLLQQAESLYAAHSYKAAYKAYANAYQAVN